MLKPDRGKCPAPCWRQTFAPFSLQGRLAVRFHGRSQANALRSQTDHEAKAPLTFPHSQTPFVSNERISDPQTNHSAKEACFD